VFLLSWRPSVATGLQPQPVSLTIQRVDATTLNLSWPVLSVITNSERTPIYPAYLLQASTDLAYWWDTGIRVPQRVGGPPIIFSTNVNTVPVMPYVYVRLRTVVDLRGADLTNRDFRDVDFTGEDFTERTSADRCSLGHIHERHTHTGAPE
jgi:hypothetical protein